MKKILLIAFRDFTVRIRNKTFWISTLLLPVGIVLFYGTIFFFTSNDTDTHNIGIVDKNNYLISKVKDGDNFHFKSLNHLIIQRNKAFGEKMDIDALIRVPISRDSFLNGHMEIVTYTKLGIMTKSKLERILQKVIEVERFAGIQIEQAKIDEIQKNIQINYQSLSGSEESDIKETIAYILSFGIGIMMYIILTIYGAQVMRGVMEEKTNRIVEIIISSVKPFELLLGKLIGIGMVSFLQLILWGVLLFIIAQISVLFLGINVHELASQAPQAGMASAIAKNPEIAKTLESLLSYNYIVIIACFLFYFLGGYFLYSSLFATVGSAVGDDPQDVQALMFPIMIPILLSFVFLSKSINNPNGTEAVIASMVPFTAPVVMMSRVVYGIPEGVPLWQLIVSMALLALTTVFFILMAARIYKVGILLYGKKVSWKKMLQWLFIK